MTARLKYNPKKYKRLAEIAQWLANGENVQWRRESVQAITFGSHWQSFAAQMPLESMISMGCDFRVKP